MVPGSICHRPKLGPLRFTKADLSLFAFCMFDLYPVVDSRRAWANKGSGEGIEPRRGQRRALPEVNLNVDFIAAISNTRSYFLQDWSANDVRYKYTRRKSI